MIITLARRVPIVVLLALLTLCLSIAAAEATTTVSLAERDLVASAAAIVVGEVTAIESFEDSQGAIFTHVTVHLHEVLHGDVPGPHITLRQVGGVVGDRAAWIEGSPEFFLGERALLFLRRNPDATLRVAHLYQGKFALLTDRVTGREYAYQEPPQGVTVVAPPSGAPPAPSVRLRRSDDFKREIRQQRRDGRGPRASRHDTVLTPTPPAGALVSSAGAFTYLGTPSRWFEPDAGQPVLMRLNSAGEPAAPGLGFDAVRAALGAWSNVPGSSFRFQDGGFTTAGGFLNDGVSAVSFRDPLGQIDPPSGCSGTLGIGGYSLASGETRVINGQTFLRILEGDVVLADGWVGCGFYENAANFAEVVAHELGHALGLGHSTDPAATMAPVAHLDGRGASLGADDIAALTFMYPGTNPGLTLGFVNPQPSAVVSGTITVTLSASGGTGLTYTVTVGSATIYSGANPSFSWNTGGVANGSRTLVGTVRDSANRTATAQVTVSVNNVAAPSLTASPASVMAGGVETATWANIPAPTTTDWIGLYTPGAADQTVLTWVYVSCSQTPGTAKAAGSCALSLSGVAPGTYQLRLFASNSYSRLATSGSFTVTAPAAASLSVSPASGGAGTTRTATWAGIPAPTATDWIGLYAPGGADGSYLAWLYVSCSKTPGAAAAAGSCPFALPTNLAPGTYELRLLASGGYTRLATSGPLTVTGSTPPSPPTGTSMSVSPATGPAGQARTATWSGIVAPSGGDWLGLYVPGAPDSTYLAWTYVSCSQTAGAAGAAGSCPFPAPGLAPGTYEVRLFGSNGFTRLATSNAFTVTAAVATSLTVTPTNGTAGQTRTTTWSGIAAPTATDWIGVYSPGAPDSAYRSWIYVSCTTTAGAAAAAGACPFPAPGTLTPGSYELRLFSNNSYTRLATSAPFAVQ